MGRARSILVTLCVILGVGVLACGTTATPGPAPEDGQSGLGRSIEAPPAASTPLPLPADVQLDPSPAPVAEPTVTPTPTSAPTATPTPTPTPEPTATVAPTATPTEVPPTGTAIVEAVVNDVVDGDTIDVLIDGQEYRVRYIGVDAPETVHPTLGEEPYGREASEYNKALVVGQTVFLEKDVSETDQYGRLLRYVWLDEETMVNALLVAEGYAQVSSYPPDVKYADDLLELEQVARQDGVGLWGFASEPAEVETPEPAQGPACDPSYPDVCIPSPPPDLDCGDIDSKDIRVVGADPHRIDGDKDGVGCES